MAAGKLMTSGALAAFIASLALAITPASAQERGRWQERSTTQGEARNGNGQQARPRSDAMQRSQQVGRPAPQPNRGYNRPGVPWSPPEVRANRHRPVPQQQPNARNPNNGNQQWNAQRRQQLNGANRTRPTDAQSEYWRNRRGASASDPWGVRNDPEWRRDNPQQAAAMDRRNTVNRQNMYNGNRQNWNNRDRANWSNNRGNWNNNRGNWNNNRGNWNTDRRGYAQNYRWDRGWRNDNRYNWYSYRNSNRNVYRLGSYYAPYRNYSYRRISSGFMLDSLFFSNRYLINDPWQYRLPAADGPYRWVRYYDDVLLVDTYSGEVVDVIHDFFW